MRGTYNHRDLANCAIYRDRNWLEFLSILDATLPPVSASSADLGSDSETKISHAQELFSKVAEQDGLKDRSGPLALLELEKRARAHNASKGRSLQ